MKPIPLDQQVRFGAGKWTDQAIVSPQKQETLRSWWAEPRDREQFSEAAKAEAERMARSRFGSVAKMFDAQGS
jgi:hypothetical protein